MNRRTMIAVAGCLLLLVAPARALLIGEAESVRFAPQPPESVVSTWLDQPDANDGDRRRIGATPGVGSHDTTLVSVTNVSEPGMFWLIMLGVVALVLYSTLRLRRKAKQKRR